jgi:hypothetical protein
MDRRKRRQERRRHAAQRCIGRAWRKFRVRILLNCVVEHIRLKARLFREQQLREEREFRMRSAMRRVKEDCQFKEWVLEQRVYPTFPMKTDTVAVVSPRLLSAVPPQQGNANEKKGLSKGSFRVLYDANKVAAPAPKVRVLSSQSYDGVSHLLSAVCPYAAPSVMSSPHK